MSRGEFTSFKSHDYIFIFNFAVFLSNGYIFLLYQRPDLFAGLIPGLSV